MNFGVSMDKEDKDTNESDYIAQLKAIEEKVIEILYAYKDNGLDSVELKKIITSEITKKFKTLNEKSFEVTLILLLHHRYIEREKITFPGREYKREGEMIIEEPFDILIYRIAPKGMAIIFEKEMMMKGEKLTNQEKSIFDLSKRITEQADDVLQTKQMINKTFNEIKDIDEKIKNIKEEFYDVRENFYTKEIEIFGIFVAIFSFIIIGFTQIPSVVKAENSWIVNLSNASAIFIPLTIVLVILIVMIGIVNWLTTRKREK